MTTAAVTIASLDSEAVVSAVPGARKEAIALVTLSNSYPVGGVTLTAAQVGLNQIDAVFCGASSDGHTVVPIKQTNGNFKLKAFKAYATEEDTTTDLSAVTVAIVAKGR